jgi:hypothetical protein
MYKGGLARRLLSTYMTDKTDKCSIFIQNLLISHKFCNNLLDIVKDNEAPASTSSQGSWILTLKVRTLRSRARKSLALSAVFGVLAKSAKLNTTKGNKQINKNTNIEFKRCRDPASYPSRSIWWVGLSRQG